jgi:hypothetical protein
MDFARQVIRYDLPPLPADEDAIFSRTERLLDFLEICYH